MSIGELGRSQHVPPERAERTPLLSERGWALLRRIVEHEAAPRWNYLVGDRLQARDLPLIEAYRERLFSGERPTFSRSGPPEAMLQWVRALRDNVSGFAERLPAGFDLRRDWGYLPTMSREQIAIEPEQCVPVDVPLDRLIVYDTSGTTGHAIVVP